MNRIQFFVLTGLSAIVVLLLIGQIALAYKISDAQTQLQLAQQLVAQGNVSQNGLKQLVSRIYTDGQRTGDTKLKDILARQQINVTPQGPQTETPAAPSSTSTR